MLRGRSSTLSHSRFGSRPLVTRLERIRDLAGELARELLRDQGDTSTASAMVDVLKQDIDIVADALKARTPLTGQ
jgi:hypothetical protein